MGSLNILPTNGVNLLSFVSQKLPPKLHKITALVIAILAVAVAVRYAFCSRTINASKFEPFSNKCTSAEDVIKHLDQKKDENFTKTNPLIKEAIQKIYNAPQNLPNDENPKSVVIDKEINLETILDVKHAFDCLNPLLNYEHGRTDDDNHSITVFQLTGQDILERNKLKEILEPEVEQAIVILKGDLTLQEQEINICFNRMSNLNKNIPFLFNYLNHKHPGYTVYNFNNCVYVSKIYQSDSSD